MAYELTIHVENTCTKPLHSAHQFCIFISTTFIKAAALCQLRISWRTGEALLLTFPISWWIPFLQVVRHGSICLFIHCSLTPCCIEWCTILVCMRMGIKPRGNTYSAGGTYNTRDMCSGERVPWGTHITVTLGPCLYKVWRGPGLHSPASYPRVLGIWSLSARVDSKISNASRERATIVVSNLDRMFSHSFTLAYSVHLHANLTIYTVWLT